MSANFRHNTSFLSSAIITRLSIAFAVGLMGLSLETVKASTFTPTIEEFQIVRDGASVFFDGFNNGTLPTSESVYAVTGPGGMTSESGGHLSNDIASLDVGRNPGGQLRIRFSDVDLSANTSQTAGTSLSHPSPARCLSNSSFLRMRIRLAQSDLSES